VTQIRKRITYANVMSSIAVFLVLGGATAFAAKKISSNQIQGNSISTGKIKKEAVTTSKIKNNSISTAKIQNDAVTGAKVKDGSLTGSDINLSSVGTVPKAASATNATNAENAQPVAFAQVSKEGVLNAANSKNVGKVTKEGTVYCFSGLPFTPRGGQANTDFSDSGLQYAQFGLGAGSSCPAGTQAFVFTLVAGTGGSEAGFFAVFYG